MGDSLNMGVRVCNDGPPVLCLHGFTGTPFSVRYLALHLGRQGRSTHAPLLAGHGRTLRDLARSRWHDWYATADKALTELVAARGGPAAVVGFSMGGLLAMELALTRPDDVSALVLMAPPLRLPSWQERGLRLFRTILPERMLRSPLVSWPKFGGPDISEGGVHLTNHGALAMPIGASASLLELAERVRIRPHEIRQPTLLVHGMCDQVIPFSVSQELLERLGSETLEHLWLPRSHHVVCLDVERREVYITVESFLARHQ